MGQWSSKLTSTRAVIEICPRAIVPELSDKDPEALLDEFMLKLFDEKGLTMPSSVIE